MSAQMLPPIKEGYQYLQVIIVVPENCDDGQVAEARTLAAHLVERRLRAERKERRAAARED